MAQRVNSHFEKKKKTKTKTKNTRCRKKYDLFNSTIKKLAKIANN